MQAVNTLKKQQKDNPMFLFLVEGHPLNSYLKFLISKLEEAKKREEEEKEKANEFALSLVSEYNDEEEPFKTEESTGGQETDTAEAVVADERPTDNAPSLEPKQSYVAMFDFTPEKDGEMSMKVHLPPTHVPLRLCVCGSLERALIVFRIGGRSAGGS